MAAKRKSARYTAPGACVDVGTTSIDQVKSTSRIPLPSQRSQRSQRSAAVSDIQLRSARAGSVLSLLFIVESVEYEDDPLLVVDELF